jgi:DNA-directed RNA polymerase subunit beta
MTNEYRIYGTSDENVKVPELSKVQQASWDNFLQKEVVAGDRALMGLEALLKETFPIKSFDGSVSLDYISYELKRPRYSIEDCRALRLTYGYLMRVRLRLNSEIPIEEDVYLTDVPVMIGGGEFLVNGTERVVVTQLHRSPGVDFTVEKSATSGKKLHYCRIIPERGSWIEIMVSLKEQLQVQIDQSNRFSATTLLRAFSPKFSTDEDILKYFYTAKEVDISKSTKAAEGKSCAEVLVYNEDGEFVRAGTVLDADLIREVRKCGKKKIKIITTDVDKSLLNSLENDANQVDPIDSYEEAIMFFYTRLRPGNPKNLDKAKQFFEQKFFEESRYQLGHVGRFRLNRKFDQKIAESQMNLTPEDFASAISYLIGLRRGEGQVDDIDDLGNRRVRTLSDLATDEFRSGFLKLKRSVQERLSMSEISEMSPRTLVSSKAISSAVDYFFSMGELSQVVDQTNALTQLSHERRLSALGPGGLNRKRAGFEVRDVHISHYGRICPIETPEGANIGLITNLSIYAKLDKRGFLTSPYREVKGGKLTGKVVHFRADQENFKNIASASTPMDKNGKLESERVQVRLDHDFKFVGSKEVDYMDFSPQQMLGVPAALIPFIEHDDANRALMGSNMMRQAVPLLQSEAPLVGTGMELKVAESSSMCIRAINRGTVSYVDAGRVEIGDDKYYLRKFSGLNEKTCLNQRTCVRLGEKIKRNQIIADGAAVDDGELALGKNILVAFMTWDGFNFEDAIIISNRLVKDDVYTSIHIHELEVDIRETKLGREEFTRDIPNVSESALRNLDESGIVRTGAFVKESDYLVGKVSPKSKTELSPEEKLLYAIFGKAGEDVKDDSLKAPAGMRGVVIDTKRFTRRSYVTDEEKAENEGKAKEVEVESGAEITDLIKKMCTELCSSAGVTELTKKSTNKVVKIKEDWTDGRWYDEFVQLDVEDLVVPESKFEDFKDVYKEHWDRIDHLATKRDRIINQLKRGHELPTGVLEKIIVYVATKRVISVGDKMAGRHGNKGVISRIVPEEDMPFMPDGRPVDIILNPLGVPSRMNVGQILETHLGWAASVLGFKARVPAFGNMDMADFEATMQEAVATDHGKRSGMQEYGKVSLCDGRTGQNYEQETTVGYIYMLKLNHLIDDKVHARATGPYSLITQQPLGGKARYGGQRYGEMEVWALEAYGAASILQEMMTVKSDDVEGRPRIYESMVKGKNILIPGIPVTYNVLTNEIKGLALNMVLNKPELPDIPADDKDKKKSGVRDVEDVSGLLKTDEKSEDAKLKEVAKIILGTDTEGETK